MKSSQLLPTVVMTLSLSMLSHLRQRKFSESIICVHICVEIYYLDLAKYSIDKTLCLTQAPHYLNNNVVHVCMETDYL